jgi:hypothetical protein
MVRRKELKPFDFVRICPPDRSLTYSVVSVDLMYGEAVVSTCVKLTDIAQVLNLTTAEYERLAT